MRKLTKEQKRDIRAIAAKGDEDIDFSDAPPVLDWSGAEIGKFYRPKKKPVTMRSDSDVIACPHLSPTVEIVASPVSATSRPRPSAFGM